MEKTMYYAQRLDDGTVLRISISRATVGMIAVGMIQPLLIVLMGFMYVLTSVSDIIQVFSVMFLHKRVFRMAPLHHHFEMGGMPETRIVAMYTLVTAILCVVALLSLTIG